MLSRIILFIAVVCFSLTSFAQKEPPKAKVIDPANMDFTKKPGDDFEMYAGGIWIKNNPIPPKETRWGSFTILRDFNVKAVRDILTESAADTKAPKGSIKKRVGDFYASGMDSLTVEKLGFTPLQQDYAKAGSVKTLDEVLNEITYMRTNGLGSPLFGFFVAQDRKHPQVMARVRIVPNRSKRPVISLCG